MLRMYLNKYFTNVHVSYILMVLLPSLYSEYIPMFVVSNVRQIEQFSAKSIRITDKI